MPHASPNSIIRGPTISATAPASATNSQNIVNVTGIGFITALRLEPSISDRQRIRVLATGDGTQRYVETHGLLTALGVIIAGAHSAPVSSMLCNALQRT